jgi:hypothetical protein
MESKEVPVTGPRLPLGTSAASKPFQHFTRDLRLNTNFLSGYLLSKYRELQTLNDVTPLGRRVGDDVMAWEESGSLSTVAWRDYNVFQFHDANLYDLLLALGDVTREACDYYEVDFKACRFMVQGWFNVNYSHVGKLDWHTHSHMGAPQFHGYYCVSAEPSQTHYDVDGQQVTVENKNNRLILGESRWPHAMGDWSWDGPRITVAYDVSPLRTLDRVHEQHYVPLP